MELGVLRPGWYVFRKMFISSVMRGCMGSRCSRTIRTPQGGTVATTSPSAVSCGCRTPLLARPKNEACSCKSFSAPSSTTCLSVSGPGCVLRRPHLRVDHRPGACIRRRVAGADETAGLRLRTAAREERATAFVAGAWTGGAHSNPESSFVIP